MATRQAKKRDPIPTFEGDPQRVSFARPKGVPNSPRKIDAPDIKVRLTDDMYGDGLEYIGLHGYRSLSEYLRDRFCQDVYGLTWFQLQVRMSQEDRARRIAEKGPARRPLMALRTVEQDIAGLRSVGGAS